MEDRLEIWLELLGGKLDRLIEIGESLEGQVRLPSEDESKTVADAKEPEHPAGPKPEPGEGCRILSKDPPEDLQPGDDFFERWAGQWRKSRDAAEGIRKQNKGQWYRRKIEVAKEPEPEYREPVLPADCGKWAEFSHDGINWMRSNLCGCYKDSESSLTIWSEKNIGFRYARIKKDA